MTREELFRAVGEVREDQLAEAEAMRRSGLRRWGSPLAACLAMAVIAAAALPWLRDQERWKGLGENFSPSITREEQMDSGGEDLNGGKEDLDGNSYWMDGEARPASNDSRNVEIGELDGPGKSGFMISSSSCLAWLDPEEIFARDTAVFRGTVRDLRFYMVQAGPDTLYYTVADVEVDACIRGDLEPGEMASVVYPGAKGYMSTSISGPLCGMDVGDEGIFMPVRTSRETGWERGDCFLCYADLGEFVLSEGMRFVFLNTGEGLEFERYVYEEIAGAETLDEVEAYVRRMAEGNLPERDASPAAP